MADCYFEVWKQFRDCNNIKDNDVVLVNSLLTPIDYSHCVKNIQHLPHMVEYSVHWYSSKHKNKNNDILTPYSLVGSECKHCLLQNCIPIKHIFSMESSSYNEFYNLYVMLLLFNLFRLNHYAIGPTLA